jgi:hypothetical protein
MAAGACDAPKRKYNLEKTIQKYLHPTNILAEKFAAIVCLTEDPYIFEAVFLEFEAGPCVGFVLESFHTDGTHDSPSE